MILFLVKIDDKKLFLLILSYQNFVKKYFQKTAKKYNKKSGERENGKLLHKPRRLRAKSYKRGDELMEDQIQAFRNKVV